MASSTARAATVALCTFAGMALFVASAAGQVDESLLVPGPDVYEIRLADGSTLFATISEVADEAIVLTTVGGSRVEVRRSQIAGIRRAEGRVEGGEFWRADPNVSRLFFTSTGRALEQGQAYFGTYLIVLPFVAVGVTDRLTIAGGAPILLGEVEPFYFAPKLQIIRTDRVAFSVGVLHFVLNGTFDDDDTDIGVAYGVGTFGSRDRALTLGMGFGYAGNDFSSRPAAVIGGELRVSRRTKLLTENYFLPGETGAVLSAGVRFIGERFSADLGVGGALDDGNSECCLPLLSLSYVFGRGS